MMRASTARYSRAKNDERCSFATHASAHDRDGLAAERYDVAVIDEIQLIGSSERGHSWTRALLGLDAREIRMCGALDASELVEDLAKKCGDDFVLKTYERLTPLKPLPVLKGWRDVRAGDCVVTFSRDDIHAVKRLIEEAKPGTKCCVVYGTLPPEPERSRRACSTRRATGTMYWWPRTRSAWG